MKKILIINLFLAALLACTGPDLHAQNNLSKLKTSEKSFPTNLSKGDFHKLKAFEGKVVAFDGIIEKIENSRNNTPLYKLKLDSSNYLWTVLMFKNNVNKIGDQVRVVGYLTLNEPNETEKNFLDGTYIVIAFGLVDFKNENLFFLDRATAGVQKTEWINGKIPSSK
jgi:hypothetical protein